MSRNINISLGILLIGLFFGLRFCENKTIENKFDMKQLKNVIKDSLMHLKDSVKEIEEKEIKFGKTILKQKDTLDIQLKRVEDLKRNRKIGFKPKIKLDSSRITELEKELFFALNLKGQKSKNKDTLLKLSYKKTYLLESKIKNYKQLNEMTKTQLKQAKKNKIKTFFLGFTVGAVVLGIILIVLM